MQFIRVKALFFFFEQGLLCSDDYVMRQSKAGHGIFSTSRADGDWSK